MSAAAAQIQAADVPLYLGRMAINPALREFFSTLGLWRDGAPVGDLAAALGPPSSVLRPDPCDRLLTEAGALALMQIVGGVDGSRLLSAQQQSQTLRRLREVLARSPGAASIVATPVAPPSAGCPRPRAARRPRAAVASHPSAIGPAAGARAVPFEPLQTPAAQAARQAFQARVARTVRDFVDFTQTSEYINAEKGPR